MQMNDQVGLKEEIEEPEDLGLKIGTPKEAKWTEILKAQTQTSINSEVNKEVADTLIILAEKKIAEEKEEFKKQKN